MIKLAGDMQKATQIELAETAMEVSHLYGFLASIYRSELSQQQLRTLQTPDMQRILEAAGISLDGCFWTKPEKVVLEELAVEFTALFLGPGGHISPHESVQIESQGAYWGDATTAVRNFIEEAGMEFSSSYHGIPDHIAVELEFMAELNRRESVAWERSDVSAVGNIIAYQRDFIDEHLGQWVEKFCALVVATAELSFYRDVAKLTAQFIATETQAIEERLEVVSALTDPPGSLISSCLSRVESPVVVS